MVASQAVNESESLQFPAMSTLQAVKDSDSPLLKLPAEIRNAIYALALVEDMPIELSEARSAICEPGLLAVNRQVRRESMPVFYGGNTFSAHYSETTTEFLDNLCGAKISLLRGVQALEVWYADRWTAHKLQFVDKMIKVWREKYGPHGLRDDAILVSLLVRRNGRDAFEWIPAPQIKEWVPQVQGDKTIFVRKEELSLVEE